MKPFERFISRFDRVLPVVPNFASIASTLTDLTQKGRPNNVEWSNAQENAFQALKGSLCKFPILKLPDISQTFVLQTDNSDSGIGAVLLQEEGGVQKPVAYASRKLKKAELLYVTIEKECLAIVWAMIRFSRFLYGQKYVLETDHFGFKQVQGGKCKTNAAGTAVSSI